MRPCIHILLALLLSFVPAFAASTNYITLNDDGGWCWFEDPRALLEGNTLVVGSIANGNPDPDRKGDIDIVSHDLSSGKTLRSTLHKNFQADDHNSPALWLRPDGRWLVLYCMHGPENKIYYRISTRPHDATQWEPEQVFVPSPTSKLTYSNPIWLAQANNGKGRLFNFFRGLDASNKTSWMFSDDLGQSWKTGGLVIDFKLGRKHRPYVKYASDNKDTVHLAFTESHPMNFDTSIYHAILRSGRLCSSDGKPIRLLTDGPIEPAEATRIYAGDSNNIAWIYGVALDGKGSPRMVFTVQKNAAAYPKGKAGKDLRYHFARWDGAQWNQTEIAYAGSSLYQGEDDYAGGIVLHPGDPNTVYISSNVDPVTGKSPGHYELYRGHTRDGGTRWQWTPITRNSAVDNIRPIALSTSTGKTILLWLRGTYTRYTIYQLQVVMQPL